MKTKSLETLGKQELKKVDGGHPIFWFIAGHIIGKLNDKSSGQDFRDGYAAAKKRYGSS